MLDSCGVISANSRTISDIRQGVVEGEGLHQEQGWRSRNDVWICNK